MAIQTPIAALLEATCGIEAYLKLVRAGTLDAAHRTYKFNSATEAVPLLRNRGHEIPEGLPHIHGDVTWRRNERHWSLDANYCILDSNLFFWSSIRKGVAKVRVDGVRLPETILDGLPGRSLNEVVNHPYLADPRICIVGVQTGGPYSSPMGLVDRPAMTSFEVTVPITIVPDPLPDTLKIAAE